MLLRGKNLLNPLKEEQKSTAKSSRQCECQDHRPRQGHKPQNSREYEKRSKECPGGQDADHGTKQREGMAAVHHCEPGEQDQKKVLSGLKRTSCQWGIQPEEQNAADDAEGIRQSIAEGAGQKGTANPPGLLFQRAGERRKSFNAGINQRDLNRNEEIPSRRAGR